MVNLDVIIAGGVGVATSIISAIVSWVLARKKYNAETDTTIIENLQKSLDFYKTLVDDNKDRLEEVLKRNDVLEKEINELRKHLFEIMSNMCYNLSCQNRQLTDAAKNTEAKKSKS